MEDRLFVYHDCAYLSELALSSDLFDALLFVYQSADGPTGLDLNDAGRSLLKVFLSPSISISSTGRVSVYDSSSAATSFFSAVMANKEIAIHGPDDVLLAEAAILAEYQKQVTIAATAARLGKNRELPRPPLLHGLFGTRMESNATLQWLLMHCSAISIWNRFTSYGTHPTVVTASGGDLLDSIRNACQNLGVALCVASIEDELPCW
jgi:hypothetical protein